MRHALLALLISVAPAAAQGKPAGPPVRANAQANAGALDEKDLPALALKVRAIRAEPKTLRLKVGQTVDLNVIKVTVVDSSGRIRGRLVGFDFGIPPGGPASVVPRRITGVRPGTAVLTVRYPRMAWKGRTDARAEATVKVVVTP